jgi:hypothetical protein
MKLLVKKVLPFLILLFAVLGCSEEARRQSREKAEAEAVVQKAVDARKAFAKQLSDKFDREPRECLFKFQTLMSSGKTLLIKNCAPTTARIKPEQVLTAEDRKNLKSLGFDEIDVDSWESAFKSQTEVWLFNEDSSLRSVSYK